MAAPVAPVRQRGAERRRGMPQLVRALAAASLVFALSGCGVPVDPGGTLDRIDAGVLRAGASASGALVLVDGTDVSGPLPDLIEGFAAQRGAQVQWTVGSEEDLVDDLEAHELDLAIGGMTADTPWSDRASVTRAYPAVPGSDGADVVVLLPLGENGTQAALERYLDRELER